MNDRADRLRRARIARGFGSAAEAARAYGWSVNTYSSNENGNATFSFKKAKEYAAAFWVRAEWLYDGQGAMSSRSRQGRPIVGKVAAGEGQFEDDFAHGAGFDVLEPLPAEGRITLVVEGDSMTPRFRHGEKVTFGPRHDDPLPLIGHEVMARLADGRRLLKILRRGSRPGLYTLYSVNTAYDPIEDVELLWALPFEELRA